MMAERDCSVGNVYVESYGPKRWAALVISPGSFQRTFVVCVRRRPTSQEEAQKLIDAMPTEKLLRLYEAANERHEAMQRASDKAAREREHAPDFPPLPDWPEV